MIAQSPALGEFPQGASGLSVLFYLPAAPDSSGARLGSPYRPLWGGACRMGLGGAGNREVRAPAWGHPLPGLPGLRGRVPRWPEGTGTAAGGLPGSEQAVTCGRCVRNRPFGGTVKVGQHSLRPRSGKDVVRGGADCFLLTRTVVLSVGASRLCFSFISGASQLHLWTENNLPKPQTKSQISEDATSSLDLLALGDHDRPLQGRLFCSGVSVM